MPERTGLLSVIVVHTQLAFTNTIYLKIKMLQLVVEMECMFLKSNVLV